jgi:hypothetical protein
MPPLVVSLTTKSVHFSPVYRAVTAIAVARRLVGVTRSLA